MLASSNQRVFASQRIRVGAIGVGGRGSLLIEQLPETAQIVAVADCNEPRAQAFRDKLKADWQIYSDYRKILDRNDLASKLAWRAKMSTPRNP
jgi:predicted dehydrogenase